MIIRRIINVLFLTILAQAAYSQSPLPNGGFEDWVFTGSYYEPYNWTTANYISEAGCPVFVEPDSPGYSGKYGLKMTTRICDIPSIPFYDTIPGMIYLGERDMPPGLPCNSKPAYLGFRYKYFPGAGLDTASVQLAFFRMKTGNTKEYIGYGSLDITVQALAWKPAVIPITWFGTGIPDTVVVYFASSKDFYRGKNSGSPGNSLSIDELVSDVPFAVGIKRQTLPVFLSGSNVVSTGAKLMIYTLPGEWNYRFTDLSGRVVLLSSESWLSAGSNGIPVPGEPGCYILEFYKNNAAERFKIIVQ